MRCRCWSSARPPRFAGWWAECWRFPACLRWWNSRNPPSGYIHLFLMLLSEIKGTYCDIRSFAGVGYVVFDSCTKTMFAISSPSGQWYSILIRMQLPESIWSVAGLGLAQFWVTTVTIKLMRRMVLQYVSFFIVLFQLLSFFISFQYYIISLYKTTQPPPLSIAFSD